MRKKRNPPIRPGKHRKIRGGGYNDPVEPEEETEEEAEEIEAELLADLNETDDETAEDEEEEPETPAEEVSLKIEKVGDNQGKITVKYVAADELPGETDLVWNKWNDTSTEEAKILKGKTLFLKVELNDTGYAEKVEIKNTSGGKTVVSPWKDGYYQIKVSGDVTLYISAEIASYPVTVWKMREGDEKPVASTDPFKSVHYTIKKGEEGEEAVKDKENVGISGTSAKVAVTSEQTLTLSVKTNDGYELDENSVTLKKADGTSVMGDDGKPVVTGKKTTEADSAYTYTYTISGTNLFEDAVIEIVAKKLYTVTVRLDYNTKGLIEKIGDLTKSTEEGEPTYDPKEWESGKTSKEYPNRHKGDKVYFYVVPKKGYEIAELDGVTPIENETNKNYYEITVDGDKTYTLSAVEIPKRTLTISDYSDFDGVTLQYATELKKSGESDANYSGTTWIEVKESTTVSVPHDEVIYLKAEAKAGYSLPKLYCTGSDGKEHELSLAPAETEETGTTAKDYYTLTMNGDYSLRATAEAAVKTITVNKNSATDVKSVYYTINGKKKELSFTGEKAGTIEKVTPADRVTLEFAMSDGYESANNRFTVTETPVKEDGTEDADNVNTKEATYNPATKRYEYEISGIKANVTLTAKAEVLVSLVMPKTTTGVSRVKYAYAQQAEGATITDGELKWQTAAAGETIQVPATGATVYLLVTPEIGYTCKKVSYAMEDKEEGATEISAETDKVYYNLSDAVSAASNVTDGEKKSYLFITAEQATQTKTLTINKAGKDDSKTALAAIRDISYTLTPEDAESWQSLGSKTQIQKIPLDMNVSLRVSMKQGYECAVKYVGTDGTEGTDVTCSNDSNNSNNSNNIYSVSLDGDTTVNINITAAASKQNVTYIVDSSITEDNKTKIFKNAPVLKKGGKELMPGADGAVSTEDNPITCEDTLVLSFTPNTDYRVTVTVKTGGKPASGDDTRKTTFAHTYYPGEACEYKRENIIKDTEITVKAEAFSSLTVKGDAHIEGLKYAVGAAPTDSEATTADDSDDSGSEGGGADTSPELEEINLPDDLTWVTAVNAKGETKINRVGEKDIVYLLVLPEDYYAVTAKKKADGLPDETITPPGKHTEDGKEWICYQLLTANEGVTLATVAEKYDVTVTRSVPEDETGVNVNGIFGAFTYKDEDGEVVSTETSTLPSDEDKDALKFSYGKTLNISFSLDKRYTPALTKTIKGEDGVEAITEDYLCVPGKTEEGKTAYSCNISGFTGNAEITIAAKRASYKVNSYVIADPANGVSSENIKDVKLQWDASVDMEDGKTNSGSISTEKDLIFTVTGVDEKYRPDVYYGEIRETESVAGAAEGDTKLEPFSRETIKKGDQSTVTYTYKIVMKDMTKDLTVLVEVRKKDESATVKLANSLPGVDNVLYADENGKYTEELGSSVVTVEEDAEFSFQITPREYYRVKEVKVNGNKVTESGSGKNKTYSFTAMAGENLISIETEPDPAQLYQLTLNLDGAPDSVEISLTPAGTDEDQGTFGESMKTAFVNNKLVTLNDSVRVTIIPAANYEFDTDKDGYAKVSLAGKQLEPDDENEKTGAKTYVLSLTKKGSAETLKVTTKAKALTETRRISFELSKNTHVSGLSVDRQENRNGEPQVVWNKETKKYEMYAGVEMLKFSLHTSGPYKPLVTCNDESFTETQEPDGYEEDGTRIWEYAIAVGFLEDDALIKIGEKEVDRSFSLSYDADETDITISQGHQTLYPRANNDDEPVYGYEIKGNEGDLNGTFPEGTALTISVKTKDGFGITGITTEKKGNDDPIEEQIADESAHQFVVNVTKNTTVTVDTGEIVWGEKLTEVGGGEVDANVVGEYDVYCGETYELSAMLGRNMPVTFTGAELYQAQKADVIPETDSKKGDLWTCTASSKNKTTRPQFTFYSPLDKGKYRLELSYQKGKKEAEKPLVLYLNLYLPVVENKVKIGSGGDITQAADTTAYYPVTVNTGASADRIYVAVKAKDPNAGEFPEEDVTFEKTENVLAAPPVIEDGQLKLTTHPVLDKSVWLMFYTDGESGKEGDDGRNYLYKNRKSGQYLTVKVTTGTLFKANVVPTVKLSSASDVALTFTVGAKNIAKPNSTQVFYELIVTPQSGYDKDFIEDQIDPLYVLKNGDSQDITVNVSNVGEGSGKAWKFDVDVRLVHVNTDKKEIPEDYLGTDGNGRKTVKDSCLLAAGTPFSKFGFAATKKPAYETKLTLRALKSTIYTGQTVAVAEPKFSKGTSYNELNGETLRDITPGLKDAEKLTFSPMDESNKIVATAGKNTALGKHTIEVCAVTGGENGSMYAAKGEITVTVVRGVEQIQVDLPSNQVYKAAGKAASLKAAVSYNQSLQDAQADTPAPKAAKVKWFVVGGDVEGGQITDGVKDELRALAKGKSFKGNIVSLVGGTVREDSSVGIKISQSGVVSIDKNCRTDVSFKVLALANDFEDSTVYALSDTVTVSGEAVRLDEARIMKAKYDNGELVEYVQIGSGKEFVAGASDLNGATLMGFLSGLKDASGYTGDMLRAYQVDAAKLTYHSSNTKAVKVDTYTGKITVLGTAKKVKLTARSGDGAKAEASVIVTVSYDGTGDLSLEIEKQADNGEKMVLWDAKQSNPVAPEDSTILEFTDTTAAVFDLTVKQKTTADGEEKWEGIPNYTNYSLSVSGGKLLTWDKKNGTAKVLVNTKQATVKLTNNEAKPKKITKKFLLTNRSGSAFNVKAPKVSFTAANKNTIGAENGVRTVGILLKENGKNYPLDLYTGKTKETGLELFARVELDRAGQKASNQKAYDAFAASLQNKSLEPLVNTNGVLTLRFNDDKLTAGSYKLKVTVGTVNDQRTFNPEAAAASVTVKVKKEPKLSYKMTTTYKLSELDCTAVELTGKKASKDMIVEFKGLKNAARNSSMGKENEFTKYFELDDSKRKLVMVKEAWDKLDGSIEEDNLVGYVEYEGYYPLTSADSHLKGTARITVKLVEKTASYTATATKADTGIYSVADVTVLRNKQPVEIAYAAVMEGKENDGNWRLIDPKDPDANEDVKQVKVEDHIAIQNLAKTDKKKTVKVTMRVIPADGHYADMAARFTDANDQAEFVRNHGIPVTVSVSLSDFNTTSGRITFAQKDKSLNYQKKELYDAENGEYYIDIPYQGVYADARAKISKIEIDGKGKFYENGIEAFDTEMGRDGDGKVNGNTGSLRISLKKDALTKSHDPKDKNWYYTVQGKAPSQWKKPSTFPVKVIVDYGKSGKDIFTFNLTMPAYPDYVTEEWEDEDGNITKLTDLAKVIDYVKKNADAFGAAAARLVERNDYANLYDKSDDALQDALEESVKTHWKDVLQNGGYSDAYGNVAGISYDCGVDFERTVISVDEYEAPNVNRAGGVSLVVTLKTGERDTGTTVHSTVRLKPLAKDGVPIIAMRQYVIAFIKNYNKDASICNIDKTGVETSLYTYLREQKHLDKSDINDYRFNITVKDIDAPESDDGATADAPKKKHVTITIEKVSETARETAKQTQKVTWDVPVGEETTPAEAMDAVYEALGMDDKGVVTDEAVIRRLTASNVQSGVETAILAAARSAIDEQLYEIDFAKEEDGENKIVFKPISKKGNEVTPGELSFTLQLKYKGGEELGDGYSNGCINLSSTDIKPDVDDTVFKTLSLDSAENAITKWIRDNTLGKGENADNSGKALTGSANEARILAAIRKDAVFEGSGVVVAFATKRNASGSLVSDLTVKKPTMNTVGSVRGTLLLTAYQESGREETRTVAIEAEIPMLSQSITEAMAAIKKALTGYTIPAGTQDGDKVITDAIIARAKRGLKSDFEVEVADGGELDITPATKTEEGSAKITLRVYKEKSGYASGQDVPIKITIPKLTAAESK